MKSRSSSSGKEGEGRDRDEDRERIGNVGIVMGTCLFLAAPDDEAGGEGLPGKPRLRFQNPNQKKPKASSHTRPGQGATKSVIIKEVVDRTVLKNDVWERKNYC